MSKLRLVLLEDSLLDAELSHALLMESGIEYELVHVKTRAEFQTALEQDSFDLILSDYSLPSFDGISALEMAHRLCPNVPFIFVTATMGEEVAIETLKQGATDYVLKQRLERLVPSVQRALREAEERRARQQAEHALRASEAQLRQQAEELQQANRVKDEFLAVLSHELRSPLNAILGWSQLLRSRKFDAATLNRALETIERNAKLQTQLIEDLLDVSRILQGKLTLHPQPTNLVTVIEAAIDTMRLAAEAKKIQLLSLLNPNVGLVSGDPNRLQQVVWNLLSNAIKFTPTDGRVEIRLERVEMGRGAGGQVGRWAGGQVGRGGDLSLATSSYAQITVKDTGIGINPDFLPHVFDYFRQADGSITRNQGGLGLGLAIVRHLVELHGGTVCAESLGEGLGATFRVMLPLLDAGGERVFSSLLTPKSLPLDGVRVLLVDDEPDSREFLVCALEQCGAIATAVDSVASALEVLQSFEPDVLVSDIGMPGEDGYTLLRQVRSLPQEKGGQIPAIALTAYAGEKDRNAALSAGFQIHLSKPVMPDEFVSVVAKLVLQ